MRIAMVSEHASPLAVVPGPVGSAGPGGLGGVDAGGQNVHVRALALALGAAGHEVVVHTRRTDPTSPDRVRIAPRVTVDHVPAGPPVAVPKDALLGHMDAFAAVLAARWAADRPDVAHAHFWMSGLAALAAGRAVGVPVLQTFHALGAVKRRHQGAEDTSPADRVARESDLGASVDRVLATCRDEVTELLALGVPLDRVEVVPCGVDTAHFTPRTGPRIGTRRVLSVSRLVPRKGVDTVVRAIAALAARPGDRTELVVAGGSAADDLGADAEAGRLLRLADALGVADRVRLLGRVDHHELPALYATAGAVACVPTYEPFGIVPLEAMACGVPVVASRVGGLTDTVVDGVTGLHVPPGDPVATADALAAVLDAPRRARALGRAGRRRAEGYGWERIAAATARIYAETASGAVGAVAATHALTSASGVRS